MKKIWKFVVPIGATAIMPAPVPGNGEIRHCGSDPESGDPALWIECEPGQPTNDREFFAIATGAAVPPYATFIGTAVCGPFVWHVFERAYGEELKAA